MSYAYSFQVTGRGTLTFDAYTGQLTTPLSDQDALFWSNYLTSFAEGFIDSGRFFQHLPPNAIRAVRPLSIVTGALDLTGAVASAGQAATPRDAVQILAAGVASALVTISAGYYTGLLAAGLPMAVSALGLSFPPFLISLGVLTTVGVASYFLEGYVDYAVKLLAGEAAALAYDIGHFISPLINNLFDPLILDLNDSGIELSGLEGSNVHFDLDGDGFAERTGWVAATDGLLVFDADQNSSVDGGAELFGSPHQDGFAILETFDTNGDGNINASDDIFGKLRIWRDLNLNGTSDVGELTTLAESGITSISLTRVDVQGTNAGHEIGFEVIFTRADGTTGAAQTIYFQTDRQDTRADNTPNFTPAQGVSQLPQLPGSGLINSVAWKATQDAGFRAAWTALADDAAALSQDVLRTRFEDLVLEWASVNGTLEGSRGGFVNAAHLAFIEKFFGTNYQEVNAGGQARTSPSTEAFGARIEASFDQIVDVMLTSFLAQTGSGAIARGGSITDALQNPYFFFSLLDFGGQSASGAIPPETLGNIGMVLDMVVALMPEGAGASAEYLVNTIAALDGIVPIAFDNDRAAYLAAAQPALASIASPELRHLATEIVKGEAVLGSAEADGLFKDTARDDVFVGGQGDDVIISGAGADLFVYAKGDGSDYIRDISTASAEKDALLLTDVAADDLTFERVGDNLIIKIEGTTDAITSEDFFADWGQADGGIDRIRFADGSFFDREAILARSTTVGDGGDNLIVDTTGNDILHGGKCDDVIRYGGGSDTIIYGAGDGFDLIEDTSGSTTEKDTLTLAGLAPSDVRLSRVGDMLRVEIVATREYVDDKWFFSSSANPDASDGWNNHGWGIERLKFANGVVWDRQTIAQNAWIRGDDRANVVGGRVYRTRSKAMEAMTPSPAFPAAIPTFGTKVTGTTRLLSRIRTPRVRTALSWRTLRRMTSN